jgi:hypothetical protein
VIVRVADTIDSSPGPAEAIGAVKTKDKNYSPLQRMLDESAHEQPWNGLERPSEDSVRGGYLCNKSACQRAKALIGHSSSATTVACESSLDKFV